MRHLTNEDLGIDVTSKDYKNKFLCIYLVDGKIVEGTQFYRKNDYSPHEKNYMLLQAKEVIKIVVVKNKTKDSKKFNKIKEVLNEL